MNGPIVTVTLNAALDLTYHVDRLVPHRTHRVREVRERAGGKGVNVARLLRGLGQPVLATGLAGGEVGGRIRDMLRAEGVPESFVPIAAQSRRTVSVVDAADATGLWEPGPRIQPAEWDRFVAHYGTLLPGAAAVVLSGSLPPGVPESGYATLVAAARSAGVPVVLDADGAPLAHGVRAGPDVVKPNEAELVGLAGPVPRDRAVTAVRALGAGAVVASVGPDGLLADTAAGRWRAWRLGRLTGNPTGAGDAAVAALTRGLVRGSPWPERLADAVALSAAAVVAPVAGTVTADDVARFRAEVIVEEAPCRS